MATTTFLAEIWFQPIFGIRASKQKKATASQGKTLEEKKKNLPLFFFA